LNKAPPHGRSVTVRAEGAESKSLSAVRPTHEPATDKAQNRNCQIASFEVRASKTLVSIIAGRELI
jgi:hypothetical protein